MRTRITSLFALETPCFAWSRKRKHAINSLFLLLILFLMQSNLSADTKFEKATFAGGCFWCMEYPFEELDGVIEVVSGYTGGHKDDPHMKGFQGGELVTWKLFRYYTTLLG